MNTRPDVDVVVTAFDCTETALVDADMFSTSH